MKAWHVDLTMMDDAMERERVCAWIEANGLDPNEVRADTLVIIDGDELTVHLFKRDEHGKRTIATIEERVRTTVPIVVRLPDPPFASFVEMPSGSPESVVSDS